MRNNSLCRAVFRAPLPSHNAAAMRHPALLHVRLRPPLACTTFPSPLLPPDPLNLTRLARYVTAKVNHRRAGFSFVKTVAIFLCFMLNSSNRRHCFFVPSCLKEFIIYSSWVTKFNDRPRQYRKQDAFAVLTGSGTPKH